MQGFQEFMSNNIHFQRVTTKICGIFRWTVPNNLGFFFSLAGIIFLTAIFKENEKIVSVRLFAITQSRGQDNALSSDIAKRVCLLIGHKFFQFQACPVILWRKNWKLFSFFLDFKVIYQRSRNNELKRCLLTTHITNIMWWKPDQ